MSEREKPILEESPFDESADREGERGDVAEADAPTAVEEDEASVILTSETPLGVQRDANDE
jgi:hypothetical protein